MVNFVTISTLLIYSSGTEQEREGGEKEESEDAEGKENKTEEDNTEKKEQDSNNQAKKENKEDQKDDQKSDKKEKEEDEKKAGTDKKKEGEKELKPKQVTVKEELNMTITHLDVPDMTEEQVAASKKKWVGENFEDGLELLIAFPPPPSVVFL